MSGSYDVNEAEVRGRGRTVYERDQGTSQCLSTRLGFDTGNVAVRFPSPARVMDSERGIERDVWWV